MGIGMPELLLIALVVLVLFGGSQLPKLAKSLGKFVSDFNKAKEGLLKDDENTKEKNTDQK